MRILLVALLVLWLPSSALAQAAQWPADKVVFDDAEDLQTKLDEGDLGGGGGISDGDKGDITVSGSGTVWNLDADVVTGTEIANDAVGATEIAVGAVGNAELANDAVTTAKILNANVTAAKLATDSVTATQIAADAVGSSEIATDAVGSDEIAALAVDTAELAADAVDATKLDETGDYVVNTITATAGFDSDAPATGVDTAVTMKENSDYDTDTYQLVLPAEVDLLGSTVTQIGPLGFPTDRTISTMVDGDDLATTYEEGYVRFFSFGTSAVNPATAALDVSIQVDMGQMGTIVSPVYGGRLVGKALSVYQWGNNSGANEECVWEARFSDPIVDASYATTAVDPTFRGADAGWTTCGGVVESGPSSSNSGGVGDTVHGYYGTHYTVPLTSCTCTTDDCVMIVAVRHRDAGTDCASIDDAYVSFVVGEVFD